MGPQYVELERDLTLLLWLGISMNDNLSQKVYTANCLSILILTECTAWFWFLTVTRALIGDQYKYSSLAGLWLVKFHGLLHYVDQIKKFGSPLRYYLAADFLESFLKDNLKKPSKRINGHLHRVQHDILILICSQESHQFGLARQILFPMEYAPVFCGTNLLSSLSLNISGGNIISEVLPSPSPWTWSSSKDSKFVPQNTGAYSIGNNICLARLDQTAGTLVSSSKSKCHDGLCAGDH